MKSENSKLLLGLGIGALVGAAVGYLMTGEHRQKLEEELREVAASGFQVILLPQPPE